MCYQHASVTTEDGLYYETPDIDWDTVAFPEGKLWIYNFIGGGWNSEIAATKSAAVRQATQRWKKVAMSSQLVIDKSSFHVASAKEHRTRCMD